MQLEKLSFANFPRLSSSDRSSTKCFQSIHTLWTKIENSTRKFTTMPNRVELGTSRENLWSKQDYLVRKNLQWLQDTDRLPKKPQLFMRTFRRFFLRNIIDGKATLNNELFLHWNIARILWKYSKQSFLFLCLFHSSCFHRGLSNIRLESTNINTI